VEFFRQPDAQIGLFFNLFSMGQLLSLPMFIAGTIAALLLSRRQATH
jgi:phosphatidylglycerol:prolipoprotein diacylglycerol transferase